MRPAGGKRGLDIFERTGDDDTDRYLPVVRRVRRIERSVAVGEPHFPFDSRQKRLSKGSDVKFPAHPWPGSRSSSDCFESCRTMPDVSGSPVSKADMSALASFHSMCGGIGATSGLAR